MKHSTFLLAAFTCLNCVLAPVAAYEVPTEVEAFSSSTHVPIGSYAVDSSESYLNNANLTNSTRRTLAQLASDTMTIQPGQLYYASFSGRSCIKFSVTSSNEDLLVVLMREASYRAFEANGFTGSYLYIQGSQCEQTYSCTRTINGLATTETYYLLAINDYDGFFGGDDARAQVLLETCPSSGSPASTIQTLLSVCIGLIAAAVTAL